MRLAKMKNKNLIVKILFSLCLLSGIVLTICIAQVISRGTTLQSYTVKASTANIPHEETSKAMKFEIPILMYHYIRVVDDPDDKTGINLSVTPDKFSEQLDYLEEEGYHTINFRDVLAGSIPEKPVILTFDDGYEDFYTSAYPELKKRNMTAVSYVITGKTSNRYLAKEQIRELSNSGIEIGSHTLSHLSLSLLGDEKAEKEISLSKQVLEEIIGQEIISFCYPAGRFNAKTVELVKKSGYDFATTTKAGLANFEDPLVLSRYRMNADTNISSYLK